MRRLDSNYFSWTPSALAVLLCLALLAGSMPAQQLSTRPYSFQSLSELVLVNVTVRDKKGDLVRNLTADDFTVLEEGKPQTITSFDVENTDAVPASGPKQAAVLTAAGTVPAPAAAPPAAPDLKDRRLILLFFDLSSMEPDEIERAATAAEDYLEKQMAPADLVAAVSLGTDLRVDQDFTSDRALLRRALESYSSGSGQGFEEGSTGDAAGTPDTGQSFTPDETEYNIFNTDRRLEALRSLAASLSRVNQKKSLIYFSNGMSRTGIENQSALRAATNAAVRANLAIYTVDIRGLEAMVPGGEARQASLRGVGAFSGRAMRNQYDSNFASQETLVALAADTGGRAMLDSNDFGQVFRRVQEDTATYYVLGYRSTNPARDGRFRRITVSVRQPGLKLEYRRGYYAPADFQHSTREDRERQLQEEMASELPSTDLPVYLAAGYFRLGDGKFFVPISLAVPGSEIPFTRSSDQDRAALDIVGAVLEEGRRPAGTLRDTVKIATPGSQEVRRKNVQYNSGFLLPPGRYHLKFVVRENQTGRVGSFETDLTVPDLKDAPVKISSVVLSNQLQAASRRSSPNPLVRDNSELIPNVTHVFSSTQRLYLYYEVYDPARPSLASPQPPQPRRPPEARVLTNVAFFRGKVKAYETPMVEAQRLTAPDRRAVVFQLEVPLAQLKPGFYTCQVNVVDDAAGKFLFPRLALLVR